MKGKRNKKHSPVEKMLACFRIKGGSIDLESAGDP